MEENNNEKISVSGADLLKDVVADEKAAKTAPKDTEKDKKDKIVRIERSYGSYSRQFDVSGVKTDEIKAKYENGVLQLKLPKKEEEKPESKRLEIE